MIALSRLLLRRAIDGCKAAEGDQDCRSCHTRSVAIFGAFLVILLSFGPTAIRVVRPASYRRSLSPSDLHHALEVNWYPSSTPAEPVTSGSADPSSQCSQSSESPPVLSSEDTEHSEDDMRL